MNNCFTKMNALEIIEHRIEELKKWMKKTNCAEYSGYLNQRYQIAHILNPEDAFITKLNCLWHLHQKMLKRIDTQRLLMLCMKAGKISLFPLIT